MISVNSWIRRSNKEEEEEVIIMVVVVVFSRDSGNSIKIKEMDTDYYNIDKHQMKKNINMNMDMKK